MKLREQRGGNADGFYKGQLQRGTLSLATGHKWRSGGITQNHSNAPLPHAEQPSNLKASSLGRCLRLLPACSTSTGSSAAGHARNRLSQSILAPVFSLNPNGIQKVGRVASKYPQGLIQ